ncbi:hypothetical protein BM43_7619 (plasmid) [Burkholderia gladioli]|nr:hypothetical protein BM43_7619 [Burkholderia gladioli]
MSEFHEATSVDCSKNEHAPEKRPTTPEFVRYAPKNARLPRKMPDYPEKCQRHTAQTLSPIGFTRSYKGVYKQGLQTRTNISTKARSKRLLITVALRVSTPPRPLRNHPVMGNKCAPLARE